MNRQRPGPPSDFRKLERKVVVFNPAQRRGPLGFEHYEDAYDTSEEREPFSEHLLFGLKGFINHHTSRVALRNGADLRNIPPRRLGHLYHSFPEGEGAQEADAPHPYRVKIPVFDLRHPFSSPPLHTRTDVLTAAHLDDAKGVEAMCVRAVALSTFRYADGIPETIGNPQSYLDRNR